jgi:uncharacterized protein YbjT (DUF2867 family)
MKVLICGASGFIGSTIANRLARDGHHVIRGVRRPARPDETAIDYTADLTPEQWLARLDGIDAVVNAVGILVEHGKQTFERIHTQAPIALFTACRMRGVRRIIQVSALGADSRETPYFASKCTADDFLLAQAGDAHIIRPAIVYGNAGASARLFRTIASLPLYMLPAGGNQPMRPVHVDDLAEIVSRLLAAEDSAAYPACIEAVGNTQVSYREMLGIYRKSMGLPPAATIGIPAWIMRWSAAVCGHIPGSTLTPDTWHMLQRGNTADVRPTVQILGRAPRGVETFIDPDTAPALRAEAFSAWHGPMLRLALAAMWILAALIRLAATPHATSLALLSRLSLHGLAAEIALYGSCLLMFGLGIASLLKPGRVLWLIQIAIVLVSTALMAVVLPELLIDPFGVVLKNLPILALLILLLSQENPH